MPHPSPLTRITEPTHNLSIDLIYASPHNFTGRILYPQALCLLHPQAETCLRKAIRVAANMDLRLKIFDVFRPQSVQEALWSVAPLLHCSGYIADPAKGSHHTRGVAIDLTLIDAKGEALDMGTPVDTMTEASHHFHAGHAAEIQINRARLLTVMLEAGFEHIAHEWWHYQLPDAHSYPLIDNATFARCVQSLLAER